MTKFPEARLKIERAHTHIEELQAVADWYCSPEFNPVPQIALGAEGLQVGFAIEPLPPQTPLILGDAVHCLRASLDYAAYALTRGKTAKERITFPFGETLANLKATMRGNPICLLDPKVLAAIETDIRPYKIDERSGVEGNTALWMLNQLDRIDKHRTILLAGHRTKVGIGRVSVREHQNTGFETSLDGNLHAIGPDIIVNAQMKSSVQIVIQEKDLFEGEPIIQTLRILADLTTNALDILEPLAN